MFDHVSLVEHRGMESVKHLEISCTEAKKIIATHLSAYVLPQNSMLQFSNLLLTHYAVDNRSNGSHSETLDTEIVSVVPFSFSFLFFLIS